MAKRYDDEFDWHGDYDAAAARRAFYTVLWLTAALLLAALAIFAG